MTHGALLSPDLGPVRAARAAHGRRRRRVLARLGAWFARPADATASQAGVALTDDEMLAESAGWW